MDISGEIYGRWTVLTYSHQDYNRKHYWKCRCDCGTEKTVSQDKLIYAGTKSCGCYAKEQTSKRRKIHGMSKSRFYGIWNDMMMRCYNPNKERYPCYGGRGIGVSKRWRTFNNFYIDMFPSYKKGLSLERKKVNGDYSKNNCIWIPIKDQWMNKTTTVRLEIDGKSLTIPEWAIISGIKKSTIYAREAKGWPAKKCVFYPLRGKPDSI